MKNILIVGTQPQRFLDQVNFARNVKRESNNLNIKFFINDKVHSKYSIILEQFEFEIINRLKKIEQFENSKKKKKKSFITLLKETVKNRLTGNQKKK